MNQIDLQRLRRAPADARVTPAPRPAGIPVSEAAAAPARTGPLVPMIIGAALLMQMLDSNVINNALPTMARSLHEDPLTLNVAITSYLLAMAVFLPISGWAADRFGAKPVFTWAIGLFTAASMGCGLAQNLPELIAARLVQGFAGALMTPVGRLVLLRSVPKSELVQAMTWLTMPALIGPVIGPPIGGFITTFASWRWIFFINLPIGVAGVTLVSLFIRDVREEGAYKLDWRGFLLTGLGLAGIVYGFQNLDRGALPFTVVIGLMVGGVLCLALYAGHARRTPHAILDLSLLRIPTFVCSTVGGAFARTAMGATPFLLAMLLQMGFGMNAFAAGMMTFASGAGALVMKGAARPIIARFGFRNILIANTFITAATFMSYSLFTAHTWKWLILLTLLVGGFFRSLHFTALNVLGYADIEQPRMSRASSLSSMGQQLAQSVGIGLAAIVVGVIRDIHHSAHLTAADVSPAFFIFGVLSLGGLFFFLPLGRDAGAEMSGRPVREVEAE
jgi:EmrB/QacA subfamily drug resistance transporter